MPKNQSKVVIASVLKPVSDPRMFEKFGRTICDEYQVHIVGMGMKELPIIPRNTFFHFPKKLNRFGQNRLFFGLFFWRKITQIKPDLIIINSPELLIYALGYKSKFKTPIIYDIRENYFKNLYYQQNYPYVIRHILAISVRMLEIITSKLIDFYILAEKSYEKELSFCQKKFRVIENKYVGDECRNWKSKIKKKTLNFIYTGTVSRTYGTIEAIHFIQKLHQFDPRVRLTIIGYCSDKKYFREILQISKNQYFIEIKIEQNPVPHHFILHEIKQADFGILSYLQNESTKNCIPTKIYEFLALKTPVIIPKNALWEQIVLPHQAGLSIDFEDIDPQKIFNKIGKYRFFPNPIPDSAWRFDRTKFRQVVKDNIQK